MRIQHSVSPQMRIHRVGALATIPQKVVRTRTDRHTTVFIHNVRLGARCNESAAHTLEISRVEYSAFLGLVLRSRRGRGGFRFRRVSHPSRIPKPGNSRIQPITKVSDVQVPIDVPLGASAVTATTQVPGLRGRNCRRITCAGGCTDTYFVVEVPPTRVALTR
jgi:hypothetical protein